MAILIDIGIDELPKIKELWNLNERYHREKSKYFSSKDSNVCFQDRIESWRKAKEIKITKIESEAELVGYCISVIEKNIGNIESIFIKENLRRNGIGTKAISEHIEWMNKMKCKKINVATVYGNEEAIEFYKKLNLLPKKIVFELK